MCCAPLPGALIPQSGYSGRPGDGTCRDCHPVKSLVAQDSSVVLGLPEAWQPETTYQCTLVIRYQGLSEWTFELTIVDSCSRQAGWVQSADERLSSVDTLDGILYFKNSLKGAFLGQPDSARWAFSYTTPSAGRGPISLYWCAYMKNRKDGGRYYLLENCLTLPEAE